MSGMRRREFIVLLGGAAATSPPLWPRAALAQPSERMPRIGVLMPFAENDPETTSRVTALRQGLRSSGGPRVATFASSIVGHPRMPTRCVCWPESLWTYDPT
jgi:hypothetical protein